VVIPKGGRDPSLPKSYRPISLLATLGKVLEAVVANRISALVEKYQLPTPNNFGARRRRSCEQALNILIEKIHDAWPEGNLHSLNAHKSVANESDTATYPKTSIGEYWLPKTRAPSTTACDLLHDSLVDPKF
jgi:hypothetical protein